MARTSLCLETLKEGRLKSTAESENKVGRIKALKKSLLVGIDWKLEYNFCTFSKNKEKRGVRSKQYGEVCL